MSHYSLVKEMYTIKPHVEGLDECRKCLKDTIHNACVVSNFDTPS